MGNGSDEYEISGKITNIKNISKGKKEVGLVKPYPRIE